MTACSIQPEVATHPNLVEGLSLLHSRLSNVSVVSQKLVRLSVDIRPVALLEVLATLTYQDIPMNYFECRDNQYSIAGIGLAKSICANKKSELSSLFDYANSVIKGSKALWFGGVSFSDKPTMQWASFPYARFILPLLEIRDDGGIFSLSVNIFVESEFEWEGKIKEVNELLRNLRVCSGRPEKNETAKFVAKKCPKFEDWNNTVVKTVGKIKDGTFSKAVLARKVDLEFEGKPNIFTALSSISNESCYRFALEFNNQIFFGNSPERLFLKRGQDITTEALAGTVRRGQSDTQDREYGSRLMRCPKLLDEHRLVVEAILETIEPLSQDVLHKSRLEILKLDKVQHAYQKVQAKLMPHVSADELLTTLHPTPAVCGYPRAKAENYILKKNAINRGWYAGAVGLISSQDTEFVVAIRSGLCENSKISLFSGVGIVEGSDPKTEWLELDAKIKAWLEVFCATEH